MLLQEPTRYHVGMSTRRTLDVLLPAKDEASIIAQCVQELRAALAPIDVDWAIILIDDGSQDETASVWQSLMAEDRRLGLLQLAGNYGKDAALLAGMRFSRADAVIPVDADLQDPPSVIARMVELWRQGYDQVVGIRRTRDDPAWKVLAAHVHYWMLGRLSHHRLPPQAGDFRLLDRGVIDRLLAMPEVDRYTKGLYVLAGGMTISVAYDRPARRGGKPAQRIHQLISLSLDGITGFTEAPLRFLLPIGALAALFGVGYLVYLLIMIGIGRPTPPGYPTIICLILVFGGIQVAALGLLGEYIARIYRESKRRPTYFVSRSEPPARASL